MILSAFSSLIFMGGVIVCESAHDGSILYRHGSLAISLKKNRQLLISEPNSEKSSRKPLSVSSSFCSGISGVPKRSIVQAPPSERESKTTALSPPIRASLPLSTSGGGSSIRSYMISHLYCFFVSSLFAA